MRASLLNCVYSNQSLYEISAWNKNFDFPEKICLKSIFTYWNRKSEHHYGILHIQISFGRKLQLETTISIFWSKFAQKDYLGFKAKKVSMTIEFSIFKSAKILNFSLKQQFSFLGPSLPKTSISPLKHKSEHHYWIVHIQIGLNTKFQFYITILIFWNKFT